MALLAIRCDDDDGGVDGDLGADAGPSDEGTNDAGDGDDDGTFAEICGRQTTEMDCTGQVLEGQANDACAWASIYQPVIQGQACMAGEPTEVCVHIAGTQGGCEADVCEDAADTRVYLKDDGSGAILRLTACGQELVSNEWTSCARGSLPIDDRTRCRCAC